MLNVVTWHWGTKYGPEYVRRLQSGVARHLKQPFRFIVAVPDPQDAHLTAIPGCLVRLRMFDPAWLARHGIGAGERVVSLDLDLIVTGGLDPLFDRTEPFVILQGANAANPCPYNGSVFMFRAGAHADLWTSFSVGEISRLPYYAFPDDQGWFAHKLPGAAGWMAGPQSGIYAYMKPGWPGGEALPADARVVCFPGRRDPADLAHVDWVRQHWLT